MAVATGFVSVPAAAADAPLLEVSHDGASFAADPDFTLFDDIGRVVPGDASTESAWVRSGSTEPGRLRVDLVDVTSDDEALASATTISLAVDGKTVGRVTIADATGPCLLVTDETILSSGQTAKLDATVSIAADLGERAGEDGRAGTLGEVGFRMRATLSDASVPPAPADACDRVDEPLPTPTPTPTDTLSVTGSGTPAAALGLGAAVVGVGAVVAAARIRRRPEGSV